jgi:hypothetical protein
MPEVTGRNAIYAFGRALPRECEPALRVRAIAAMSCDASYILPIRLGGSDGIEELAAYLKSLDVSEIIVVNASSPDLFAALEAAIGGIAQHIAPRADVRGANGKARGVLTGLAVATRTNVVVADDDVRYDAATLREIVRLLGVADVVRPQNFFSPAPWHAVLDGARSLINRALDGDWPGTLAFRQCALPNGYNAHVLFENFELVRTIRARGGRELVARGLFVARRPPTVRHYASQRVRQAYDEFARPARLAFALALGPAILTAVVLGAWNVIFGLSLAAIALAGVGWVRGGAFAHFSVFCVVAAPLWVLERAACSWLAVYERLRFGGVRYGDTLISDAASPRNQLARWTS